MDKFKQQFSIVNLAQQDIPFVHEDVKGRSHWVQVGLKLTDDFFFTINGAYNTSSTNAACIEGIADLIFGKGVYTKNEGFAETLKKILPQEELKKVIFDLKLFGNGTGVIAIEKGLKFNFKNLTPTSVSSNTLLFANTVGSGNTGLYVVNSSNGDELVGKTRAIGFNIMI